MTRVEQHKIILALRDYEQKMTRAEQEEFRMLVKRDKDDEDLDAMAKKKLEDLYTTYVTNRPKRAVKSPFGDDLKI